MKSKKTLILAIVFTLLTTIFAMSGEGENKPDVAKKQVTVSKMDDSDINKELGEKRFALKNIWPDQEIVEKMSDEKYLQFKKEYFEKATKLGIKEYRQEVLFTHRFNVNVFKELEKLGVDYNTCFYQSRDVFSYKESSLWSQVIFKGKVVEKIYDERIEAYFGTTVKVKIEDIIVGNNFFRAVPEHIYIKFRARRGGRATHDPVLDIESTHVFFLDRTFFNRLASKNKYLLTDDLNNENVFTHQSYINCNKRYTYQNYKGEIIIDESIDEVIANIKKISRIEDKANFFNRKYTKNGGK